MSVVLSISGVPQYLRESAFFTSLEESRHEDKFCVPHKYFAAEPYPRSVNDIKHIMSTLHFWGVDNCPDELAAYVLTYPRPYPTSMLSEFENDIPYAKTLAKILASPSRNPLRIAYSCGDLSVVKFLESHGYDCGNPCKVACINNSLKCLQHARQNGDSWITGMLEIAVQRGHIECLQYAVENGCPWKLSAATALSVNALWGNGHAVEQHREGYGLCCKNHPCDARHLECVQYAHEHGQYWGTLILVAAAESGHLSCIKFARSVGCPWTVDVTTMCASGGHLACLQHCVSAGCPLDATTALVRAAAGGHTHLVPFLLEHRAVWTSACVTVATMHGHKDFVALALQHGCRLKEAAVREAAARGDLALLKTLLEHFCPLSALAYRRAAEARHWHCCNFLQLKQCPLPWSLWWDTFLRGLAAVEAALGYYSL